MAMFSLCVCGQMAMFSLCGGGKWQCSVVCVWATGNVQSCVCMGKWQYSVCVCANGNVQFVCVQMAMYSLCVCVCGQLAMFSLYVWANDNVQSCHSCTYYVCEYVFVYTCVGMHVCVCMCECVCVCVCKWQYSVVCGTHLRVIWFVSDSHVLTGSGSGFAAEWSHWPWQASVWPEHVLGTGETFLHHHKSTEPVCEQWQVGGGKETGPVVQARLITVKTCFCVGICYLWHFISASPPRTRVHLLQSSLPIFIHSYPWATGLTNGQCS